jgi:DNA-binding SARP family transcriptional activator
MLRFQLLGGFEVTHVDQPIPGLTRLRMQSLLAYLLLHCDVPQSRAHISFTFWPDSSDSQARTNLRRELLQLRRVLPQSEDYLHTDSQAIQWNPVAAYSLDVNDFVAALTAAETTDNAQKHAGLLQKAVTLYQGTLLPGLYDEWILAKREELDQQYVRALEQLTALYADDRDYTAAIRVAQRLLRHDPLNEPIYLRLMEFYAHQNDRARALHTYHTCVTVLARELDIAPGAEVQRLYEQLYLKETAGEAKSDREKFDSTQLVGRRSEWQVLLNAWQRAASGRAHLLMIKGEAGIGKTRLGEELLNWVHRQGLLIARTRAYAAEGRLAYAPIIEWLRSDSLRVRVAELDAVWQAEIARLLPELLGDDPLLHRLDPLTERWQRQRLFEALARVVAVEKQPKLLFIDDLQWCDQETLEWLHFLLRFKPAAPLLVMATVRVGEVAVDHPLQALLHALEQSEQVTGVRLSHLSLDETLALATGISGEALGGEEADYLFNASEGNPLFVVEMVHAGHHRQQVRNQKEAARDRDPGISSVELPPKVHAVIQDRLRQLSPAARALAGIAATIGRSFDFDVLAATSEDSEISVANGLDELWRRRIVREQDINRYDFSHDRIREVAYAAIGPVQRQMLHRRVAQALASVHADELNTVSGELARHCERAGLLDRAIAWHERAAKAASILYALDKSISHCRSGLKLLQSLPTSEGRKRRELQLLMSLASFTNVSMGLTAPEYEETLLRARELAVEIHDIDNQIAIAGALTSVTIATGRSEQGLAFAREGLAFARQTQDPTHFTSALWRDARVAQHLGRFDHVKAALEQAMAIFASASSRGDEVLLKGKRSVELALAINHWLQGYPEQALADSRSAMSRTDDPHNMFDATNAMFFASILYRNVGAYDLLAPQVEQMLSLGARYNLPLSQQSGKVFRGWELAHQGRLSEGIQWTRRGVDEFREMGHTMFQTHRLAMLAEMLMWAHQWEEADSIVREALAISERASEHFWDVELYRLQGDLLLAREGLHEKAEQSYQRAIEIAQQQHARSLQLRATMALSRLWQRQGKTEQAHEHLVDLYGLFTEGFDTHDLCAARALLDQLC